MSIFKGRKKLGPLLVGIWLIANGLVGLIHLDFLLMDKILAAMAIAAGALLLLDR